MLFQSITFLLVISIIGFFDQVDARHPLSTRRWQSDNKWIPTWGSMPQLTEPANLPSPPFNQTGQVFYNSTIRQTIHTSIGGSKIRLYFSNAFGTYDLPITAVTVALPTNQTAGINGIQTHTIKTVTFSGSANYTVPQGGLVISDPIDFAVLPQSILTVTMYLADGQQSNFVTSHPGSRTTSWYTLGNQVSAASLSGTSLASAAHWYFLSTVEVLSSKDSRAVIMVGDSITDGRGSDTNKNNRWPDLLLAKMQKSPRTSNIAVINEAAGGNRLLNDGLGPNGLSRIDRDVLSHPGVEYALIFIGVNDIGTASISSSAQSSTADRLIAGYKQIITRLHSFDITVIGATITPMSAPGFNVTAQAYGDPEREKTRNKVNEWIRNSGMYDEVVDFDKWIRNGTDTSQLAGLYNSGDWLHPNVAGYQKIADTFPLDVFD